MRYTQGDVLNSLDAPDEPDWEIEEAIVTDERVAIDWTEDEEQWVLIAHSTDGTEYKGSYGIDKPEYGCEITLWRYEAKSGHVLLLGQYRDRQDGSGGWCMFELHPPEA